MRLGAGALHVWHADLDAAGEMLGWLLDCDELVRAEQIVSERTRRRWIAARGALRALLGCYLDEDPRDLRFATQDLGKPELHHRDRTLRDRTLHFNMSHSGPLALYAVSEMCAVGVDVESTDRRWDPEPITASGGGFKVHAGTRATGSRAASEIGLARRVFGDTMAERLQTMQPRARRLALLRAWVRYEAEGKRVGAGVGNAWAHLAENTRGGHASEQGPWIAELDLGCDAVGAVALARAPLEISLRRWPA